MNSDNFFSNLLTYSNLPFLKARFNLVKEETGKYLVTPLKVIALMVAISGVFAMIFEVRHHAEFASKIYFVRLSATLIAFLILVFLSSKNAMKYSIPLVHILLLTIISSSAFMILLIPNSLIVNSQIVGLMIFTSAMFLNWEIKNQILVAIYYNIVFAVAILFNDQKIYFLPNMYESLIFVLFLSFLSVVGSAIIFIVRLQGAENSLRVEELRTKKVTDSYKNKVDRPKLLSEVRKNGSVENFITTLIDKNKIEKIVKMNVHFATDEITGRDYLEGTIRDVSNEILSQTMRERAELELKIEKEKSDALAKEALKLSTAKSRFLANMSHEIRTPMNGIIGSLALIENESYKDKEELKQYIHSAKLSAESLLETINAVLDLSKIEAGKIELENLNFNLKKVITQAISIVSSKAKEKSLDIYTDIPEDKNLNFAGDPTRIRQIFLNLLSNAIKFTKAGEIKIITRIEKLETGKIKIHNSILDTGIGIPADKIKELFKPFSQDTGNDGNSLGGTGLGLVICKEFVNLMEGDISVSSVQGKGSKFDFNIIVNE